VLSNSEIITPVNPVLIDKGLLSLANVSQSMSFEEY
jgi:hypothetical protein